MTCDKYKRSEIRKVLKLARKRFLYRDTYLLENQANERSMTHKFAEYLQDIFGCEWHVDCEYNRYESNTKKINEIKERLEECVKDPKKDDTEAKTIYPDIIVHKRGENGYNLLVIEAKKNANNRNSEKDKTKLKKIKKEFGYEYSVFLNFKSSDSEKDIVIKYIK